MLAHFPPAVPEIPVANVDLAIEYYTSKLGYTFDWGNEKGGIAGISRGDCRLFLTNTSFRSHHGNATPVLIWLNMDDEAEVDELHAEWSANGARIISPPESKEWKLHEFTAADLDGNLFRVFYDFS